ncbi:hypothetical protein [Halalkalibacter urbisdiaboli]|uniref:hypothetical protein n=1 Tax=Halalkalibacter urbisdiaboli TaxID=1960589 RepID=UPI000B43E602|nr:hypothetical protein [Halalkalibacter urbisdiaboli]
MKIISFMLINLLLATVTVDFSSERTTVEEVKDEEQAQEERVSKIIEQAHEQLNDIVGFGRYRAFEEMYKERETYWEKETNRLYTNANQIENIIELAHPSYHHDLKNFVMITRYAVEHYDFKSLIYSHRIIHDLDAIFNQKNKELYGATKVTKEQGKSAEHYEIHVLGIVEKVKKDQGDMIEAKA